MIKANGGSVPKRTMSELSPAAQAVLDAFCADNHGVYLEGDPERIAAAFRAAADKAPPPHHHEEDAFHSGYWAALKHLQTIANELDPRP